MDTDAENADVKKEYYVTEALKAAVKANDTTHTLDLETAKADAKSLQREADEAIQEAAEAW